MNYKTKIETKILKVLKKMDFSSSFARLKDHNLIDLKSISKIITKDNKISFAIDIGILGLNSNQGQLIIEKIKNELRKITKNPINIVLTSEQSNYNKPTNKIEIPNDKKGNKSTVSGVKNVIAIASGKGGVGKSTFAVNLAVSLKRIGFKVGIVDADIYGPSISYLMNLSGKPEIEDNLMVPINNYGIDCVSIGSLVDSKKATVWRGPMVTKTLNQLISGAKWQDIDYLIIDLPPGTGDVHLSLVQQFKPMEVVIVSTPQNLSIIDVRKAVDMFETLEVPILGIVQNMAYMQDKNTGAKNYIFGQDGAKELAKELGINFLGDIALDPEIGKASDAQEPIAHLSPSSGIAFNYGRITEKIIDKS